MEGGSTRGWGGARGGGLAGPMPGRPGVRRHAAAREHGARAATRGGHRSGAAVPRHASRSRRCDAYLCICTCCAAATRCANSCMGSARKQTERRGSATLESSTIWPRALARCTWYVDVFSSQWKTRPSRHCPTPLSSVSSTIAVGWIPRLARCFVLCSTHPCGVFRSMSTLSKYCSGRRILDPVWPGAGTLLSMPCPSSICTRFCTASIDSIAPRGGEVASAGLREAVAGLPLRSRVGEPCMPRGPPLSRAPSATQNRRQPPGDKLRTGRA